MGDFEYRQGVLHAEGVSLAAIAEKVGTPFYCYSTAALERNYRRIQDAFKAQKIDPLICYAMKANSNQAVLRTLGRLGAGMDVIAEGELRRALAAGISASKVIFAGVGKTRDELAFAFKQNILSFNVESEPELKALSEVAANLGATARIAVRVNPDVDAKTHAKISTGKAEDKFGVPYAYAVDLYEKARKLPGISVTGVHMHIGSQITDLAPFRLAFSVLRDMVRDLRTKHFNIEHIDLGGGLGIDYSGEDTIGTRIAQYATIVSEAFRELETTIVLEPGRMIVGDAGILVSKVIYSKKGARKTFTIVDAAMNDLVRPTLYDAYHKILPVNELGSGEKSSPQDVVGPLCETGDYLALDRPLPPFAAGDLLAVMSAGAYGATMSSTYNSRLLVPEVLVKGNEFAVVRPRPSYDELIGLDRMPNWLQSDFERTPRKKITPRTSRNRRSESRATPTGS